MKIWILTGRYGTELWEPEVFYSKDEAYARSRAIIWEAARDSYNGDTEAPTREDVEKWAEEKGYYFDDGFFWDRCNDATEVAVTEKEINL